MNSTALAHSGVLSRACSSISPSAAVDSRRRRYHLIRVDIPLTLRLVFLEQPGNHFAEMQLEDIFKLAGCSIGVVALPDRAIRILEGFKEGLDALILLDLLSKFRILQTDLQ